MENESFFRELEGNRWPEKGSILDSMGADIASWLIGQDPETGRIPEQKAHDAIDGEINKWDLSMESMPQEHQDLLMGLVMGGSGRGANIGKAGKNILSNILARNAKSLRNLRQGQGTGAQSMSSADRGFLNKEWDVWNKLKDSLK